MKSIEKNFEESSFEKTFAVIFIINPTVGMQQ